MEATSEDWKSPFCLLEAHGFETWLVTARDVKHLPGRLKTDTLDAVWLGRGRRAAAAPGPASCRHRRSVSSATWPAPGRI
jgi:hypothetical protein